ncbi:hypothetical protein L7F22_069177 [Adiantum nelumboides]|nr:hypothetical protein [Adiantum nelumboides]
MLTRWYSANLGESLIHQLRTTVFDHVQRMPVAFFTRTRTGALVSRLNSDVLGAQRAFSDTLAGVVSNVVVLVLTLAAMLVISWPVTLLVTLLLPAFLVPARLMGRRLAALERAAADHNAAMSTRMTERFSRARRHPDHAVRPPGARVRRVRRAGGPGPRDRGALGDAAVDVRDGADARVVAGRRRRLRRRGRVRAGRGAVGGERRGARAAAHPALPAADRAGRRPDGDHDRAGQLRAGARGPRPGADDHRRPGARPVPDGPVGVEFDRVSFAYPTADQVSLASLEEVATLDTRGGEQVLHEVSFSAPPGAVVAVVGSSGAGKSTVAQLLARLYDVGDGAVRIGGVDVRELTTASVHRAVGFVTQDGHLLHDTVAANLRIGAPEATDAELWAALRRARLDGLVAALPDGLATVVGERGYRLSGGERQRMTIARVLLARPRIVVLDEATASLDTTSEAAVQAALAEALDGRTALVIAHRLSTVRHADEILVLEQGRIVERGDHAGLLAGGRATPSCGPGRRPLPSGSPPATPRR